MQLDQSLDSSRFCNSLRKVDILEDDGGRKMLRKMVSVCFRCELSQIGK